MTLDPDVLGRFVLEWTVIVGCFLCVWKRPEAQIVSASFGLLGVIVASIVSNLAKL